MNSQCENHRSGGLRGARWALTGAAGRLQRGPGAEGPLRPDCSPGRPGRSAGRTGLPRGSDAAGKALSLEGVAGTFPSASLSEV